jgi:hypothetical protein
MGNKPDSFGTRFLEAPIGKRVFGVIEVPVPLSAIVDLTPNRPRSVIERIEHGSHLLALIVSHRYNTPGISFFTPNELSQQLAYMRHPAGKVIEPHVHNPVNRSVQFTQETLLIRRGKLRVDFYDDEQNYLASRILEAGDVILLVRGGHGFEVLEELEMFEVKQGPYAGDDDKTRFVGKHPQRLRSAAPLNELEKETSDEPVTRAGAEPV